MSMENLEWEHDPGTGRRRGRGRRVVILVIVAVLLVTAALAGGYVLNLADSLRSQTTYVPIEQEESDGGASTSTSPATSTAAPVTDAEGTNYLLMGSDKRSDTDGGVSGQRSDVMMLVHVTEERDQAYVTSFPRDLWIDIPGHGKGRINSALAHGGMPLAVNTVSQFVGVEIDHAALIDFEGFADVIDLLGGIEVEVTEPFSTDGYTFSTGMQEMGGEEALAFVRERKELSGGDFSRNANQRAVIDGIVRAIVADGYLSNPLKLANLVDTVAPYLTVDDGLGPGGMVSTGWSLRALRPDSIFYLSAPHGDPFMTSGGASVVAVDEAGMTQLREALAEDAMGPYYTENAGQR